MLFNSEIFILGFLPVAYSVFFLLCPLGPRVAAGWLGLASLAFYGWWNPVHVPLLLASIAFNFAVGLAIIGAVQAGRDRPAGSWLVAGVAGDLALLGWFKYAGFAAGVAHDVLGTPVPGFVQGIVLPLGISFFTFTQIAFLVDSRQGKVRETDPVSYLLFVTYFPHLIAGPVLHHAEMMPQFARASTFRFDPLRLAVGASVFAIGLMKKVWLADGVAPTADQVFAAAGAGAAVPAADAWLGALAYTLQLYFDFSGYCDMAIGLSYMIGIRLPLNFDSPYKAASIIEFWRRWHMTLSRFLRDYLYVPLGGNRRGRTRRYVNLMVTMLLGGLWHGAGWAFVVWGGLHGLYLVINHLWRALRRRLGLADGAAGIAGRAASVLLTFTAVTVAWVFFRAEALDDALRLVGAMAGLGPAAAPVPGLDRLAAAGWIGGLLAIAWLCPNTQQIATLARPALGRVPAVAPAWRWLLWRPLPAWGAAAALLFAFAFLANRDATRFLYFNF